MIYPFSEIFANSSLIDPLHLLWHTVIVYVSDIANTLTNTQSKSILSAFESLPDYLCFNEFQLTLLKTFTAILLINIVLIFAAWHFYGKKICERFMKPATSRAIEELKASVDRLKLPKEHTPRI